MVCMLLIPFRPKSHRWDKVTFNISFKLSCLALFKKKKLQGSLGSVIAKEQFKNTAPQLFANTSHPQHSIDSTNIEGLMQHMGMKFGKSAHHWVHILQ